MVEEYEVSSIDEYLKLTGETTLEWIKKFKLDPHTKADPWFRGEIDRRFQLLPSFFRVCDDVLKTIENDRGMREEFQQRARSLTHKRPPANEWEWYFLMQHYEMPTRLLDWTDGSLIALFFAVTDYKKLEQVKDEIDGAVWMMHPSELAKRALSTDEIPPYYDPRVKSYLWWNYKESSPSVPMPILPAHHSRRIVAQRGQFTVHGNKRRPLETYFAEDACGLKKFIITATNKRHIREGLRLAGISDVVLFPELPFLSLEVLRAWNVHYCQDTNCQECASLKSSGQDGR